MLPYYTAPGNTHHTHTSTILCNNALHYSITTHINTGSCYRKSGVIIVATYYNNNSHSNT